MHSKREILSNVFLPRRHGGTEKKNLKVIFLENELSLWGFVTDGR
jgi:hypothetical protein